MIKLHMHTIHLCKYFHLPQVIDMLQPRQEDSGLQRSRHSLIHLLYFMQKERFHVFNKSIIIIVMQ